MARISREIAKYKIYLDRARSYVGYIQFALLLQLVLSNLGITNLYVVIIGVIVSIIGFLFIGFLDTRFGIRSREMENNALQNPVYIEMLNRLKSIENEVKRNNNVI